MPDDRHALNLLTFKPLNLSQPYSLIHPISLFKPLNLFSLKKISH